MLSCIRYMVYPAIHTYIYIICIIRTTRPGARGRPAITTRTTRFRRAVHPRQHSSKSREHLFRKPSPGKPGRPLQKKRPSRADSLHYACKPFRVPHTSGALTTCPANATTSRRHGKNPAYCLSINSITQAGYKDKKFIFNNALYAPNAHHTTRFPTTGRISPAAAGRHILPGGRVPTPADIILCQIMSKKSIRPTSPDSLTETGFRASETIPGPFFL